MAPRFAIFPEPHSHATYDFHYDSYSSLSQDAGTKLVIVMVGLPARGKSYITEKLCRYLNWLQHEAKIFTVSDRRRELFSNSNSLCETSCKVHLQRQSLETSKLTLQSFLVLKMRVRTSCGRSL